MTHGWSDAPGTGSRDRQRPHSAEIVWELFQDLEGFRLDEYKQMDDGGEGMARLIRYFQAALARKGGKCIRISDTHFLVQSANEPAFRITTDREAAKEDEQTSLLGLEHPLVKQLLDDDRQLEASARALSPLRAITRKAFLRSGMFRSRTQLSDLYKGSFLLDWMVKESATNQSRSCPVPWQFISGDRMHIHDAARTELVTTVIPDMLRRDLAHKGLLSDSVTVNRRLLAWVEFV